MNKKEIFKNSLYIIIIICCMTFALIGESLILNLFDYMGW